MSISQQPLKRRNTDDFVSDIASGLMDENLQTRFGTSLQINMGKEYQKLLLDKYRQLQFEFKKINKDPTDGITITELIEFLNNNNQLTGQKFSREYGEKLFEMIDLDHNKVLTVEEFVISYIQLEEKLKIQRIKLKKIDEDLTSLKEKQQKGMAENRNEIVNKYGIANNALLSVTLFEGRDLKPDDFLGKFDPYIMMRVDTEKITSNYKPDTLDPVWNEDYSFGITSKDQTLRIELYDKSHPEQLEGYLEIPLQDLAHQQKIEEWYDLLKKDGSAHSGAIRLKLHFLWSRFQFFTEGFNYYENEIKKNNESREILEEFYNLLDKNFGILYCGNVEKINKILDERPHERAIDMSEINPIRKSIFISPNNNSRKSIRFTIAAMGENFFKTALGTTEMKWTNYMKYNMMCIVALTSLILLERSDFVNLLVSTCIVIIFLRQNLMEKYAKKLYLFERAAIIIAGYDFLWLLSHYNGHFRGNGTWLQKLVYFFSFCNFICKILLSVSLYIQVQKADLKVIQGKNEGGKFDRNSMPRNSIRKF